MREEAKRPDWLVPGARVVVRLQSSSVRDYRATVQAVQWPWLVWLEGEAGAVHPSRLEPDTEPG